MKKEEALRKIERLARKVEAYNAELERYFQTTEDHELPDIDSTVIGSFSEAFPYRVRRNRTGFTATNEGMTYRVTAKTWEDDRTDWYIDGWDNKPFDNLKDDLNFDKRRLSKAWKVWEAEDPDRELERDDDEE